MEATFIDGTLTFQRDTHFSFFAGRYNTYHRTPEPRKHCPVIFSENLVSQNNSYSVLERKADSDAGLILIPPATPGPVLIDESIVNNMPSEDKSHFPNEISKPKASQ